MCQAQKYQACRSCRIYDSQCSVSLTVHSGLGFLYPQEGVPLPNPHRHNGRPHCSLDCMLHTFLWECITVNYSEMGRMSFRKWNNKNYLGWFQCLKERVIQNTFSLFPPSSISHLFHFRWNTWLHLRNYHHLSFFSLRKQNVIHCTWSTSVTLYCMTFLIMLHLDFTSFDSSIFFPICQ